MVTLLVTGPIGSGKSEVCRYMQSRGIPVYDCDFRTKRLYESVPGLKSRIELELGLPWERIGEVFSDLSLLSRLEGIVYPLVVEDIKAWKRCHAAFPLVAIESAIALEKPQFDALYDKVLLVTADLRLRTGRNSHAAERDRLQKFDMSRTDFQIENNSSIEELHNKTEQLICRLI